MDYSPQRQNAAIPQPKNRNISRKGAKRAKKTRSKLGVLGVLAGE
jgi:hypothetical protein